MLFCAYVLGQCSVIYALLFQAIVIFLHVTHPDPDPFLSVGSNNNNNNDNT